MGRDSGKLERACCMDSGKANCCCIEMQTVMADFLIFQEKPESEFLFVFYLYTLNF